MRSLFLFLALAAIICIAAAADQSSMGVFISTHFEPDAPAQASALMADGNYYLVTSGGKEIYVVDASSGKAVSSMPQLAGILEQDARGREGYEARISSAAAFPTQVKDAKRINEDECVQYIGDDSDPGCYDRQSCLVSCFSVPQCEIIVQSDGFLEASMDWNSKRKEFASGLDAFSNGIDAIRFDASAIDARLAILSNLSLLAENMSQNGIFLNKEEAGCSGLTATRRCYEYCPKIDYSPSSISSQAQNLASLKSALAKIGQQQSRAEAMLNRSLENDAYVSSRGQDYDDFRMKMKGDIRLLKAEGLVLAPSVLDPQVDDMIAQLENISSKAKNYSDAGYYKKSLALRPQFESLANETSQRLNYDEAVYTSYLLGVSGIEENLKNSAWLIGNASVSYYRANLTALKANYTAPLTLFEIEEASSIAKSLGASLEAEIASKAVQAGNSSSPPPSPSAPQPSIVIPDFAWAGALMLAAALIYAMMLRFARREPPIVPLPPPPTQ